MVVESERKVRCLGCREVFTVYKYVGLDGDSWGSHSCKNPDDRDKVFALLDKDEEIVENVA